MGRTQAEEKKAVEAGYWSLFRYNPLLEKEGKNPFQLDSKKPSTRLRDYMYNENRYRILKKTNPDAAEAFMQESEKLVLEKWDRYEALAKGSRPAPEDASKRPPGMKPPGMKPPGMKPSGMK